MSDVFGHDDPILTPSNKPPPRAPENAEPFGQNDQVLAGQPQPRAQSNAPQVSGTRAFTEGAASGLSGNLRDEFYGLSRASGLPEWVGGFRAPVGAARMGYEYATGHPGEATSSYETGRDYMRGIQKGGEEQHPVLYPSGEVAGAVGGAALPVGRVAEGAGALARAGQAAKVGGTYGLISGFGAGEGLPGSLANAAVGGAVGTVLGAGLSPVHDLAGFVGKKLYQAGSAAYQALRGSIKPSFIEDEAARRILTAHKADTERGPVWTPEAAAAAQKADIPVGVVDVGGERTMGLARSSANQSPEAREALTGLAQERYAGQATRTAQFVRDLVGGPDATTIQEQLQAEARKQNAPAYKRLYEQNNDVIWSPELQRLSQAPAMQEAIQHAAERGQDRAIANGMDKFEPNMGMQHWDTAYRGIRDAASAAFRAGRNEEGSSLNGLAQQLRNELDAQVPAYKQVREGAASFFGAQDALEAGRNFVSARGENADYMRGLAKMNPAERGLFASGFASELAGKVHELRDAQNVLNQTFLTSPAARERVNMALGPDKAKELEVYLRAETLADRLRGALGNSTTARQLHEMGLAATGGAGLLAGEGLEFFRGEGGSNEGHALGMALAIGGAFAKHKSDVVQRSVARAVGEMLASKDSAVLDRGIKIVARNKALMKALRTAGDHFAIAGANVVGPQIRSQVSPYESNAGAQQGP